MNFLRIFATFQLAHNNLHFYLDKTSIAFFKLNFSMLYLDVEEGTF